MGRGKGTKKGKEKGNNDGAQGKQEQVVQDQVQSSDAESLDMLVKRLVAEQMKEKSVEFESLQKRVQNLELGSEDLEKEVSWYRGELTRKNLELERRNEELENLQAMCQHEENKMKVQIAKLEYEVTKLKRRLDDVETLLARDSAMKEVRTLFKAILFSITRRYSMTLEELVQKVRKKPKWLNSKGQEIGILPTNAKDFSGPRFVISKELLLQVPRMFSMCSDLSQIMHKTTTEKLKLVFSNSYLEPDQSEYVNCGNNCSGRRCIPISGRVRMSLA